VMCVGVGKGRGGRCGNRGGGNLESGGGGGGGGGSEAG